MSQEKPPYTVGEMAEEMLEHVVDGLVQLAG
jgi:hypothetical protein